MTNTIQGYWWTLFIFVLLKSIFDYNRSQEAYKAQTIILVLFSVVFFVFLLSMNIAYTENEFICGKRNFSLAIYSTIFPYIFIYMLGILMINIFPGWLRGFSNTFGLTVIRMCGFDEKDFLQQQNSNVKGEDAGQNTEELLQKIYDNPTPLFNELVDYPSDDIKDWPNITGLKHLNKDNNIKKKYKLLGYMLIKDNVAIYLWVALLSSITILVSENNLLSNTCNPDPKDDEQFQKYLATQLRE